MKSLASGARIADRYVLESVIARGGMGAVYKAVDERLGRTVAIKVLLAELAEDDTSIERFEREASATARLTHPAVVQLFDFGKHEGLPYIVMELVVGRTLATELDQQRRIAPTRACDIIEQALGGIGAAHAAGIIHRDLKPGNIMLVPTGTGREVVKVLDFGIAQLKESPTYHRLTKTGAVLGTPTFMSPEQARGETCDPRADIYAMGVVLWCCLTGQRPFVAADVPTTLGKVLGEMPPRADKIDPNVSAAIAHATERAMEKKPSARYASATEFAEALADARMQSRIPATATVSLPPERDSEPPQMTREMEVAFPMGATATQASMPVTHSSPPTALPVASAAPRWRMWAIAFLALALVLGVLLGVVVVAGVIEYRADAERLSASPPALVAPIAPLLPSFAPGNPAPAAAPVCEQLHLCCTHVRATVRPDFPDCDVFVGDLQGEPDLCAQRLVMLQQMAGTPIPAGVRRPLMPLGPGQLVGSRYRIEASIARGGMGVVYRAIDERLARGVALKVMHAELAGDATEVTRFTREAAAMASLHHPGLVQVLDAGQDAGVPYLVMELVHGRTLAQVLDAGGKLDPMRAADIAEQALFAISVAHGAGIVHRDLKPGNLMIVDTGGRELVKVLDFGIAQLKTGTAYTRLTQTGAIVGTPTFMAPEQVRGESCDARTDVYAMGVLLWCLLTGRRPFVGTDVADTIIKVLKEMPPRADRLEARVPAALATAIEIAMSKQRENRFASASAFAAALTDSRSKPRHSATALMPSPAPRTSFAPTYSPSIAPSPPSVLASPVSSPALSPRLLLGVVGLLSIVVLTLGCLLAAVVLHFYRLAPAETAASGGGILGGVTPNAPMAPSEPMDACQRAARCCNTLVAGMGGDASSCAQLAGLGRYGAQAESACERNYATYADVARQHGLRCE